MNRHVLLVDDQPPVLEALRRQLSTRMDVETASNGLDALALIEDFEPFAVVISDIDMPGMDGTTFLEKVGQATPDSVRMILTGQADLESTIAAVNFGRYARSTAPAFNRSEDPESWRNESRENAREGVTAADRHGAGRGRHEQQWIEVGTEGSRDNPLYPASLAKL